MKKENFYYVISYLGLILFIYIYSQLIWLWFPIMLFFGVLSLGIIGLIFLPIMSILIMADLGVRTNLMFWHVNKYLLKISFVLVNIYFYYEYINFIQGDGVLALDRNDWIILVSFFHIPYMIGLIFDKKIRKILDKCFKRMEIK